MGINDVFCNRVVVKKTCNLNWFVAKLIQLSVEWLSKQKNILLKLVRYKDWMKNQLMSKEKHVNHLQNAWITVAQNHIRTLRKAGSVEAKFQDLNGCALFHITRHTHWIQCLYECKYKWVVQQVLIFTNLTRNCVQNKSRAKLRPKSNIASFVCKCKAVNMHVASSKYADDLFFRTTSQILGT